MGLTAIEVPATTERAAAAVLDALDRFTTAELDAAEANLVETLSERFPDADETAVLEAADGTVVNDEQAAARAHDRLAEELPRAFALARPDEREGAVHELLRVERDRIAERRTSRTCRAVSKLAATEGRLG